MMRLWIVTALLLFALACAREQAATQEADKWDPGAVVTVPPDVAACITQARTAKLYRVTGEFSEDFEKHKAAPKVGGYPAFASAAVPRHIAKEIATILTDGSNYFRENEAWMCLPQPFYLIEFEGSGGGAHVVIHECGDVEITTPGAKAQSRLWGHGLRPSPSEARLWKLLRETLPSRPNCCG